MSLLMIPALFSNTRACIALTRLTSWSTAVELISSRYHPNVSIWLGVSTYRHHERREICTLVRTTVARNYDTTAAGCRKGNGTPRHARLAPSFNFAHRIV